MVGVVISLHQNIQTLDAFHEHETWKKPVFLIEHEARKKGDSQGRGGATLHILHQSKNTKEHTNRDN